MSALGEATRRISHARKSGATELDLRGLGLSELPESLAAVEALEALSLSDNRLTSVPSWLAELPKLRRLIISNNRLRTLPDSIGRLTRLEGLFVDGNRLSSLPAAIGMLNSLRVFYVQYNELTDVPDSLADLENLEDLHLGGARGGNRFGYVPPVLRRLTQLKVLGLANLGLTELPNWLSEFTSLHRLNLGGNKLTDLPPWIAQLPDLSELFTWSNPFNPELRSACNEGLDALRHYLLARTDGEIILNEAKLILVGEGGVGKSSLLGALRGDPWQDGRVTTHGVEIKPVALTHPETNTTITLNAWDFGGQPLYRPTHQLFFTAPAVYLVVWDPRRGPKQSAVDEWIKIVKHRACDETKPEEHPRVLVVATCGGPKERRDHIDEHALRMQFGELIRDFFHIDSHTEYRLNELKAAIVQTAGGLAHVGRSVPASWKRVLDALRERSTTDPYITYAQFEQLCEQQKVGPELAATYATILNELGYLIHYSGDPALKDTVILKADWLSKAISFVLEDEKVKAQNGLVDHERLGELWNDPGRDAAERYPPEIHPIFLRLMERFDLSYPVVLPGRHVDARPLPGGMPAGTSLVAQLVRGDRPEELAADWPAEVSHGDSQRVQVCRIVDAETKRPATADGLLYRLIVRLHHYSLGRRDYTRSRHWQRGLLVDDAYNGRALIEEIGGDIRITVRAAYPERLLHHLCEEVKWLVDNFWKGLNCLITVPCATPGCVGALEIKALVESRREGRLEYPCETCRKWQEIDALLATGSPMPDTNRLMSELRKVQAEIKRAVETGFDTVRVDLRTFMSQVDEQFAGLMTALTDEAKEGPRLFSFVPVDPKFFGKPNWMSVNVRLTLWCEYARLPLPAIDPENATAGVYELALPRDWIIKSAPLLKAIAGTLSLLLPVAASTTKFMLDDAAYKGIEKELDLGQKSIDAALKAGGSAGSWMSHADSKQFEYGESIRAEGGVLRELHTLLGEKDRRYGGLVRVQNKRREFLWVHQQFAREY
jgi:C-terminal of Roc, COR, domain/Ras of Complex, Roc, domain of DAPkinase/Leucine rich repeat